MCTKKIRKRCFICGRRLIIDKLEDKGKNRFQCIDVFVCEYFKGKVSGKRRINRKLLDTLVN